MRQILALKAARVVGEGGGESGIAAVAPTDIGPGISREAVQLVLNGE